MKEIYELKNEVDRLKQKVKDQDNDVSDKAKLSLLEYENSFLKEELRNKQLIVEKLVDLKTHKINVQKPSKNRGYGRLYKADYQKKTRYYTSSHWPKQSYKQCKYKE